MKKILKKIFIFVFMPLVNFHKVFWLYQATKNNFVREYCRFIMKKNGVHISKGAQIASGVSFPHPIAIVIGAGVTIESNTRIYQGVTLGVKNYKDYTPNKVNKMNYPKLMEGAVIYANSVIVGGIIIGENAIVAANSFVSKSVPPNRIVAGNPAKII